MNNSYLVRGLAKETREWVIGYYLGECCGSVVIVSPNEVGYDCGGYIDDTQGYECIPETVSRCSGLLDGSTPPKQVFDGDILRSNDYPFYSNGIDQYYGVVFWDKETASFCIETVRSAHATASGCSDGNSSSLEDIKDFQVIGNVYDNLSLLRENYKF